MKARLFLVLAAISFSNSAAKSQQDGNFLGSGQGAFPSRKYAEPVSPAIKSVNGKIYDVNHNYLWKLKSGTIEDISGNEILVMGREENFVLKNYPGQSALTKSVSVMAMSIGIGKFKYDGVSYSGTYETWDCGTEPTPEQWKQIQDEEARAQALIEEQKAEAQKAAQAKIYAAQGFLAVFGGIRIGAGGACPPPNRAW